MLLFTLNTPLAGVDMPLFCKYVELTLQTIRMWLLASELQYL